MFKKFRVLCCITLSVMLGILAGASSVFAFGFNFGDIEGNLDTTFSLGASFRVESRDYNLIGKANQPDFVNNPFKHTDKDAAYKNQYGSGKVPDGLWSMNGDDGDLNFDTGVISELVKITTDLSLKYLDYGFFMRGMFFYDIYLMSESDDMRVDIMDNEDAKDQIGRGADLLDAFAYFNTYIGDTPFSIRAGRQVINWGESSYIPHGISESNPIDVGKLRSPGAELKEAYIPVGSIWTSIGFTENINLEAFYQYEFKRMIPDAPGSYFSTNDFIGDGGNWIQSGFQYPDLKQFGPYRTSVFNHVCERIEDKDASNNGQFGLKFSWFAEQLNYTEFGFYFLNYHSRRPLLSGHVHDGVEDDLKGLLGGMLKTNVQKYLENSFIEAYGKEKGVEVFNSTAIQLRLSEMDTEDYFLVASRQVSTASVQSYLSGSDKDTIFRASDKQRASRYFFNSGDIYGSDSDFAGHTKDGWIHGYTEYPENIKLFGLSFNTVLPNGMSVAGEYSYRMDEPLQIDDVEMIMALSGPMYDLLNIMGYEPFKSLPLNEDGSHPYYSQHESADEPFEALPGDYIIGYQLFDISQAQVSFTQLFSDVMGASKMTALAEFGYVFVHNFPDHDELRFDALGTVRSGNPTHAAIYDGIEGFFSGLHAIQGYAPEGVEENDFASAFSWGYRLMAQLDYTNVFSGVNITPKLTFGHDVYGNTPVPIATFMKHRKTGSLNINFDYQRKYSLDLGGRMYWGAGSANRMADRDYVWITLKFAI